MPFAAAGLLALLLCLPALRQPASRPWGVLLLAGWGLVAGLWLLPALVAGEGSGWNVPGALLAAAGSAGLAGLLHRRAGLSWAELGLVLRPRPGSTGPALALAFSALLLHALVLALTGTGRPVAALPPGTWLYQATLPGMVEEFVFRGLGLALADRAFPARRRVLGVTAGWGAVVVSAVFVALHGHSAAALLGALPAALLYLWLRLRTGSLLLPVLVHNGWNLLVVAAAARAAA